MTDSALFDPAAPLTASGNLRRRQLFSRLADTGARASALIAVGVLAIVVYSVAHRGGSAVSWHFLTRDPPQFGGASGGIAPAIIGTGLIVALATAIAMPVGVLVALYLTEYAGSTSQRVIQGALNAMQGLPSIVVGVVVFGLLVAGHGDTGYAGSVALSIIMLPLIARGSQEVLLRVPGSLREAAEALGVNHWRTVVGVILPSSLGGIVTATILAVARAAGETAPLLLCDSIFGNGVDVKIFGEGIPNIPVMIFELSEGDDPTGFSRAWGAAFVLLAAILLANIGARALLARSQRKLSG
jgi:phosphate transport system permease protein